MAILVVVAIRDRALDAFMQPWFVPSEGLAIRAFQDEVNNKDAPMNKHPEDYELFRIGTFDDRTGQVKPEGAQSLAVAQRMLTKGE